MTQQEKDVIQMKKNSAFQIEGPYRMNIPMLLLTLILVCFGLIMLFSASMSAGYQDRQNPLFYVFKQGFSTFLGVAMVAVIIMIPIKKFDRTYFVIFAYLLTLGLVIYTMLKGTIDGNARRWVDIGPVHFQPSELAKIALIFCIAGYRSFVVRKRKAGKFHSDNPRKQAYLNCAIDIVIPACAILTCLIFVLLQPHISCFIIMAVISVLCFLVSGIPIRSWIDGGLVLLVIILVGTCGFMLFTNESQKEKFVGNFEHAAIRLNIFQTLNAEDSGDTSSSSSVSSQDTADENEVYQSKQSMIAIGSGGVSGVGFGSSRQKYQYLPEAHNDFVFAIACEELGFVGGVSIIVLFWAFLCGGLSIAWRAQSDFARILAVGYTSLISIQAFLNIGVAVGVIPPTGITLPFFSYGGTANLFFLIAVGLILAVSRTGVSRKKITYID